MISKVAFFVAALAVVNATALLHGAALASTGLSSISRHQDGHGNFAFRYDIDAAGASSSHAETGSTVAKIIAAPVVAHHAIPTVWHAPIAAHGVAIPAPIAAHGVAIPAPIAPALVAGPLAYGAGHLGLGHGVRAYGAGIHGVHAYGAGIHGVHAYGPGILGLNHPGKFIL